jgi:hypothetical protein
VSVLTSAAPSRQARLWLASAALFLPALIPVAEHCLEHEPGRHPSGFIQPDLPSYMSNAREHFDNGGFQLTYGLPTSPDYDTPRVYFQPHTLALGLLWKFSRMDPGLLFALFGALCGIACCRVALALCEGLFGLRTGAQQLGAVGFVWGGGLLVAAGFPRWLATRDPNDLFHYDPFSGLWFLNLGRNFIFPSEALYHLLFLGAIYLFMARRYAAAVAMVALVSACHPFTGVELICIALAWAVLERAFRLEGAPAVPVIAALALVAAAHLGYYRWYLGRASPEHRMLEQQWVLLTQTWILRAGNIIPGYALAAGLAIWRIRSPARARECFAAPANRLLAVWAVVAFALANNDLFLKPNIQPLHFTRGYVWMPLFLLGAPALIAGLQWLLARPCRWAGAVAAMGVLLSDNAVFLATFHHRSATRLDEMYLWPGFRELAAFLGGRENQGALVLSPDPPQALFNRFNYLLLTYTPLRTWNSHPFNTPDAARRHREVLDLFEKGVFLPEWSRRKLLIVVPGGTPPAHWLAQRGARQVFRNAVFEVFRIDPAPQPGR